jgi:hypothetical protein
MNRKVAKVKKVNGQNNLNDITLWALPVSHILA